MDNTKEVTGKIREIRGIDGFRNRGAVIQIRDGIRLIEQTMPTEFLPDTAEEGKEVIISITV